MPGTPISQARKYFPMVNPNKLLRGNGGLGTNQFEYRGLACVLCLFAHIGDDCLLRRCGFPQLGGHINLLADLMVNIDLHFVAVVTIDNSVFSLGQCCVLTLGR